MTPPKISEISLRLKNKPQPKIGVWIRPTHKLQAPNFLAQPGNLRDICNQVIHDFENLPIFLFFCLDEFMRGKDYFKLKYWTFYEMNLKFKLIYQKIQDV